MKRIKKWFLDRFLPMWAKETVLADNRNLQRQLVALEQKLEQKEAYIAGLETGLRVQRRIIIHNGEVRK